MAYALFAQRKLVLDSQLTFAQLEQTVKANEQMSLATRKLGLDQQLSANETSLGLQLAEKYAELAKAENDDARKAKEAEIEELKLRQQAELADLNAEIYAVGVQEQAIELEVKRLDTLVTALQKQLEAVEQAEGKGIENATPHFGGLQ